MSDFNLDRALELTPEQRAYIAGFFDGEGHVALTYQSHTGYPIAYVGIAQNRPAVLHWIASFFGNTVIYDRHGKIYRWRTSKPITIKVFLQLIRPYTHVKSQEIDEILAYIKYRDSMTKEDVDASIARIQAFRKPPEEAST